MSVFCRVSLLCLFPLLGQRMIIMEHYNIFFCFLKPTPANLFFSWEKRQIGEKSVSAKMKRNFSKWAGEENREKYALGKSKKSF